jgi:hypothetical protein
MDKVINYSILLYNNAPLEIISNIYCTIISDSTFDYIITEDLHNDNLNDNIIILNINNTSYIIRLLSKSGSTFTKISDNNQLKILELKNKINNYFYIPLHNSMKLKNENDILAGILQYNKLKHLAIELPTIFSFNDEFINLYNKELYSRYETNENNEIELDDYHACDDGIIYLLTKYIQFINKPNSIIFSIGWNSYNDFNFNDLNLELNNILNFIKV